MIDFDTSLNICWDSLTESTLLRSVEELWNLEIRKTPDRFQIFVCLGQPSASFFWEKIASDKSFAPGLVALFASDQVFSDDVLSDLHGAANQSESYLQIWDKRRLAQLFNKHPHVAVKNGLVLESPTLMNSLYIPEFKIPSTNESRFVNRDREIERINKFLRSPQNLIIVSGLPGIGKSALVANAANKNVEFEHKAFLKLNRTIQATNLLTFFNHAFLSKQIYDFDPICTNSRFSDELRIEVLCRIISNNRFLFILDNFEDLLEDRKIANKQISRLLCEVIANAGNSRFIITTRIIPEHFVNLQNKVSALKLQPLERTVVKDLCKQRLENLQNFFNSGTSEFDYSETIYSMTGGIPLLIELLNSFIASQSLEYAIDRSVVEFSRFLIDEIIESTSSQSKRALNLLAVLDDNIDQAIFNEISVRTDDIANVVSTGLVSFDPSEMTYSMHPLVRSIIANSLTKEEAQKLHMLAADILDRVYSAIHKDDRIRHFVDRKRILHLLEAQQIEKCAELLGQVASRFLSFNSDHELEQLIDQVESLASSPSALAWVTNAKAHLADFRRAFQLSDSMYEMMFEVSRQCNDYALSALATSNYGTVFRRAGKFEQANDYYRRAFIIAETHGLSKMMGSTLNNLGQSYRYTKQYKKALDAFEKAVQIRTNEKDEYRLAATLSHLGALCLDIESSKEMLEEDLANRRTHYWIDRGYLYLTRSVELQKSQGNYWLIDRSYDELARYWSLKGIKNQQKKFHDLANDIRLAKGVFIDPLYN